jgi:hypothetical protein
MRRFAIDWLGRADVDACASIMAEDYSILIGGHTLAGREDAYIPGTLAQLHRFPGLLLTVQELFTDGDRVAMRFTEHGPSEVDDMAPAAWGGIGLFWWDGERLTRNVTEEDYHSRRRQLAGRSSDPVESPAPAPWAALPVPADPAAESVVRTWLEKGSLAGVGLDDGWTGQPTPPLLDVTRAAVGELFSAGNRVAFQAVQTGRYLGGLPDTAGCEGREASMSVVGMVTAGPDGTVTGRVVRDRVGLRRAVRA